LTRKRATIKARTPEEFRRWEKLAEKLRKKTTTSQPSLSRSWGTFSQT